MSEAPLTPEQVKAARELLGWWQSDLAARIRVNERTIRAFEANELWGLALDLDLVRTALESAGAIFVEEKGEGPGVRLRKGLE